MDRRAQLRIRHIRPGSAFPHRLHRAVGGNQEKSDAVYNALFGGWVFEHWTADGPVDISSFAQPQTNSKVAFEVSESEGDGVSEVTVKIGVESDADLAGSEFGEYGKLFGGRMEVLRMAGDGAEVFARD